MDEPRELGRRQAGIAAELVDLAGGRFRQQQ